MHLRPPPGNFPNRASKTALRSLSYSDLARRFGYKKPGNRGRPWADTKRVNAPPRILIVNDDDDSLFLMELGVAKVFAAAAISKCRTPAEALSLLAAERVDAIITDNGMPGMTGVEMVRRIRRHDHVVPILMVTGAEQIRSEAFEAGVNSFSSSGSWDEIRQCIRELLPAPPRAGTGKGEAS